MVGFGHFLFSAWSLLEVSKSFRQSVKAAERLSVQLQAHVSDLQAFTAAITPAAASLTVLAELTAAD